MRISDWSSDVCSSDLANHPRFIANLDRSIAALGVPQNDPLSRIAIRKTSGKVISLLYFHTFTAQHGFLPMQHYYTIMRAPHEIGRASCRDRVCQYVSI